MAHYAIVVDLDRCIGCHGCEIACKNENNIALGEYWNKDVYKRQLFLNTKAVYDAGKDTLIIELRNSTP